MKIVMNQSLLHILEEVDRPTSGKVFADGLDVYEYETEHHIGITAQIMVYRNKG